jgi:hypothetical protein
VWIGGALRLGMSSAPRATLVLRCSSTIPRAFSSSRLCCEYQRAPTGASCSTFSNLRADARAFWWKVSDSCLYEVEVDERVVRHRGDMLLTQKIFEAVQAQLPSAEIARRYWKSDLTSTSCAELLVDYATVKQVSCDQRERIKPLRNASGYGGWEPKVGIARQFLSGEGRKGV